MGAIALLRQAFYDAQWHDETNNYLNLSLDALNRQRNSTMFFKTRDKLEILRAQKIADEFELRFNYLGSGNEYEILEQKLGGKGASEKTANGIISSIKI